MDLQKSNIISPEQSGSTEDQVTYIAQKIEDGFQDEQYTLTAWVDTDGCTTRSEMLSSA